MKYIFKQIDDISGANAVTTVEFSADSLPDILEHFEMFIRGSGFHPTGTLDYVNDFEEPPEWHNEEFETPEEPVHDWTQTLRDDVEWPFAKQTAEYTTPKFEPAEELYDEMDYGVANRHRPKNTSPWDWTVNELMKGPITTKDVEVKIPSDYSINYGAGQPIVTVNGGIDTITLTDFNVGSGGISCELCGLPRNVMKSHSCHDDNCPKGTWK